MSFCKEYCITPLFKSIISWSHQVLSERNAAFLKNTDVYANYILKKCYPSLKGLLQRSLWKEWHIFIKIYGRQNALVLNECYAHLRVLLYTFSKECCPLCRRMLHRGMPQLPQGMPHSFKFSTMTYEKHAVARKIWVDTVLGFRNYNFSREQYAYPCKTFHISLGCRELCQEDAVLLEDKMKSSVNQIPLVHACYKDMQHRSKHNSIIWAWHNWAKLKFLSDIHWLNTIQYFIAKLAVFWHISTKLNGLSCLAGLLSGPCSFLLPDVQTWICTVHTQDLKPTVLPQYIDEMRSRSSMAKKTHSHSPPLSKKKIAKLVYNYK